jgi:hypothetical protein
MFTVERWKEPQITSRSSASVLDCPSTSSKGTVFGVQPRFRGGGTKLLPSVISTHYRSLFDRNEELSFNAAQRAARIIDLDGDDFSDVHDSKLRDDIQFLNATSEELLRWRLKSQLA